MVDGIGGLERQPADSHEHDKKGQDVLQKSTPQAPGRALCRRQGASR